MQADKAIRKRFRKPPGDLRPVPLRLKPCKTPRLISDQMPAAQAGLVQGLDEILQAGGGVECFLIIE